MKQLLTAASSPMKKGFDPLRVSVFQCSNDTIQVAKPLFQRAARVCRKAHFAALFGLAMIAGCSGLEDAKPLPNLVPVSGTVTFMGDPLGHGTVSFAPVDPKKCQPATGIIKEGKFKMMTTVSAEGVMAGKYKVMVESIEPFDIKPGESPPMTPAPSLIPTKYNSIETSGLEVEVKSGMGPYDVEIKK